MATTVPPIQYSSRDYAALRADLIAAKRIRLPEWTSESANDFGIVLIELFAYVGDMLSFYADRLANEAYLDTAVLRSSVLAIARMLDYRPTGTTAAAVTLQFTTTPIGITTIPARTQVQTVPQPGESPVIFETDTALVVPSGSTTGTVTATEGVTISGEQLGVSDGSLDQLYAMFRSPVIDGSVTVSVDEGAGTVQWTAFDHLIDAGPNDSAYATYVDENGITRVRFGDDVNGRVPGSGGTITATYRIGSGQVGNVGANTLTQLTTPVVVSGVTQQITGVANAAAANGGADVESLDSIRANAPKSIVTINRAVTVADYAALALRVAGVALSNAAAATATSVTLYIAPAGGGVASSALKTAVQAYLEPRKMINTVVTLADPNYVNINVTAAVAVQPTYKQAVVQAAVVSAVQALLAFSAVSFGMRVTLSSIYAAINGTPGVAYGNVTVLSTSSTGLADVVTTSDQIPQAGTITITATGGIL